MIFLKGYSWVDVSLEFFNFNGCMYDIFLILYYLCNVEVVSLREGDEVLIEFFFDCEIYFLKVRYKGIESDIKVKGMGCYKMYKFSLEFIVGEVFNEGDEMLVFVL